MALKLGGKAVPQNQVSPRKKEIEVDDFFGAGGVRSSSRSLFNDDRAGEGDMHKEWFEDMIRRVAEDYKEWPWLDGEGKCDFEVFKMRQPRSVSASSAHRCLHRAASTSALCSTSSTPHIQHHVMSNQHCVLYAAFGCGLC